MTKYVITIGLLLGVLLGDVRGDTRTISWEDISIAIQKELGTDYQPIIVDSEYQNGTHSAIGKIHKAYVSESLKEGLTYEVDVWDCDDIAFALKGYANQTTAKRGELSYALGVLLFKQDSGEGHAINVRAFRQGSEVRLRFFEPDSVNMSRVRLSEREKRNIFLIIF